MKKLIKSVKETRWIDHFIQFFIVLLSITIAFNLESYRQNVNDRKEVLINMQNMLEELHTDIIYFSQKINRNKSKLKLAQGFLDKQYKELPVDDKNYTQLITNNFEDEKFSPMDITFTSMIYSGKISSIQNHKIRNKMIELYHRLYDTVKDDEKKDIERGQYMHSMKSGISYWDEKTNRNIFKYPKFNMYLNDIILIYQKKDQHYVFVMEQCKELQELVRKEIEK
jgi:hypothetical protein